MNIQTYKTPQIDPQNDLIQIIKDSIPSIAENSILVITSKVVALWQNRVVPMGSIDHDELVKKEADKYLPRATTPKGMLMHTIKNNTLIGSAGIDKSSSRNLYILWPAEPDKTAESIRNELKQHYRLKNLGVLITDSRSMPMRRGTVGICIGYAGFLPLKDYRLDPLYKDVISTIKQSNVADSLAAAAVVIMGESAERTPLAIINDVPFVTFTNAAKANNLPYSDYIVPLEEDLYAPLLRDLPWEEGLKD